MDSWIVNSEVFAHPFNCLIAGPAQSGKTFFINQLIKYNRVLIDRPPDRIIFCYSIWQQKYDEIKSMDASVEFYKGIYNIDEINPNINNLIIFDDLSKECESDPNILNLFIVGSHHQNISVILIVHNIFSKGRHFRTMNLNSHYLIIFKNPRDKTQINTLSRQLYPNKSNFLIEAYQDAVETKTYSYLFIDLKQSTIEKNRVQTNIFPGEQRIFYTPK